MKTIFLIITITIFGIAVASFVLYDSFYFEPSTGNWYVVETDLAKTFFDNCRMRELSCHGPALCLTNKQVCGPGPEGAFVYVDLIKPPENIGIILPLVVSMEEKFGPKISHEQLQESSFEIASIGEPWYIMIDEQPLDLVGYRQNSQNSTVLAYYDSKITDARQKTMYDFLVNGGVMVITQKLSDPESTYRFLANHQNQDSMILVDSHVSQLSSIEYAMPAILYVYPGDDRQISVWAYVSDEDIIKIGKKLSITVQGYLPVDLDMYREGVGK